MTSLKIKSPALLVEFLKKYTPINKEILLEIENQQLKAKICTIDKAVVKSSTVDLNSIFDYNPLDLPSGVLKIGIFNATKIESSFKQFTWTNDTRFNVEHTTIGGEEVATEISIVDDTLSMNFPCASLNLFKFVISDEIIAKISDTTGAIYTFNLDKEKLARVASLNAVDSEYKLISFVANDKGVTVKGKSFKLELSNVAVQKQEDLKIYKGHFAMLDKEAFNVFVMADKLIFKSTESNTITLIGKTDE